MPWFLYFTFKGIFGGFANILERNGVVFQDNLLLQLLSLHELFLMGICISTYIHKDLTKNYKGALITIISGFFVLLPVNFIMQIDTENQVIQLILCWLFLIPVCLGFSINSLFQKYILKMILLRFQKLSDSF